VVAIALTCPLGNRCAAASLVVDKRKAQAANDFVSVPGSQSTGNDPMSRPDWRGKKGQDEFGRSWVESEIAMNSNSLGTSG
jgi:hypothetical protein